MSVRKSLPTYVAAKAKNGTRNLGPNMDNIQKFDIQNYKVQINDQWEKYDIIINTASPEILCNKELGELRWRGRNFEFMVLPVEYAFPKNVIFMYYANHEKFTRVVEYKKFTQYKSPNTLISLEYPSDRGRLYPIPSSKDKDLAKRYFNLFKYTWGKCLCWSWYI